MKLLSYFQPLNPAVCQRWSVSWRNKNNINKKANNEDPEDPAAQYLACKKKTSNK